MTVTIPQPPALAVDNKDISMKTATLKSDYQDLAMLANGLDDDLRPLLDHSSLGSTTAAAI